MRRTLLGAVLLACGASLASAQSTATPNPTASPTATRPRTLSNQVVWGQAPVGSVHRDLEWHFLLDGTYVFTATRFSAVYLGVTAIDPHDPMDIFMVSMAPPLPVGATLTAFTCHRTTTACSVISNAIVVPPLPTPTATLTMTATATRTTTPTASGTPTNPATRTMTPTPTATDTAVPTATETATAVPTATLTATVTQTPIPTPRAPQLLILQWEYGVPMITIEQRTATAVPPP